MYILDSKGEGSSTIGFLCAGFSKQETALRAQVVYHKTCFERSLCCAIVCLVNYIANLYSSILNYLFLSSQYIMHQTEQDPTQLVYWQPVLNATFIYICF